MEEGEVQLYKYWKLTKRGCSIKEFATLMDISRRIADKNLCSMKKRQVAYVRDEVREGRWSYVYYPSTWLINECVTRKL